jgi:hypothetical protein
MRDRVCVCERELREGERMGESEETEMVERGERKRE